MADLMLSFSKQTGRQTPSYLEGKTPPELYELLKTATGKAKADIMKALKAAGERNKQKARGGKREPKTPPQDDDASDTLEFLLEAAIAGDSSGIFDLSMPELTVPLTSTLTEERLTICGVGIVSCPF